jgi:hypothetical protein
VVVAASKVVRVRAAVIVACALLLALGAKPGWSAGGSCCPDRAATAPCAPAYAAVEVPLTPASAQEEALLERYLALLQADLDERAVAALQRMDGTGRRLLAARSYLRSGRHLGERWSWSQPQIDAWQGSPEQALFEGEIERVRAAFEAANPGFTLYVNPQVRSLEIQLDHWNQNDLVGTAGEAMRAAILATVTASGFPGPDEAGASSAFRAALVAHQPEPAAPLAAPGLSPHGQMYAVDFQVSKGGELVASASMAEVASVWDALGWRAKLQDAVRVAGGKFSGPLQSPDEPWHYEFIGIAR